jgi:hypothetical protein
MIRSMEWFSFASALDLNMDYYHIKINADSQNLCIIVFHDTWQNTNTNATHAYQVCLLPVVFQKVMSKLVQDME